MRSAQFDDIYFSAEDGLAETRHTFLEGNGLPAAWAGRKRFCVAELGFGTGLNMLAVWRLFEESAAPDQRLDLVSIEKYPLTALQIQEALAPWDLQRQLDLLLTSYPIRARGFHRLNLTPRVTLTLVFDDVMAALPQIDARVDAWFLDGFAPAKNPEMWRPEIFAQMARLSNTGATLATFTAAGDVRRGLQAAGFGIEKRDGFGRKRDMVVGKYSGTAQRAGPSVGKVVVVGAGIAGLSAAWHLKEAGIDVTVYEAGPSIASGASGNAHALVNPKLTVNPSPQTAYYTAAYGYALHMLRDPLGMQGPGSLHLQTDDDRARRFAGYIANLGWDRDHMELLDAQKASDIASVRIDVPCLYYCDAMLTSPRDVCTTLARELDVRLDTRIESLDKFETVILANAAAVTQFCDVPVSKVRGQVTHCAPNDVSANISANLCYGGYITPGWGGMHVVGATFQPWDEATEIRADDHARNLEGLAKAIPSLGDMQAQGGWVGFRAASKDRFPLVGQVADNAYISTAHGSHGVSSGLMAGAVLAARLSGQPAPVPADSIRALEPTRFHGSLQESAAKSKLLRVK